MDYPLLAFYAFAAAAVMSAVAVISVRNPVQAALFLVLTFFTVACTWILAGAEFLGIALVLVYVGAVMVLFLFVVMMLDIDMDKLRQGFWGYFPFAATIGVIIVLEMAAVLFRGFLTLDPRVPPATSIGNTRELGKLIYTQYVYAFEIAAVVLLVAIVAAVALTMRRRKDSKYYDPSDAVKVKSTDRLRVISMKSETERPAPAAEAAASVPPKQ
jgi:NADH-quinone oxidoreductase subunit J